MFIAQSQSQSPDSDSNRQISRIGNCSGGSQDDGDDNDATLNNTAKTKLKKSACGCGSHFSKAKKVVLLPFTNRKKYHLTHQSNTNPKPPPSLPPSGKKVFHSCLCFKQPSALESPSPQSQTYDPNHPNFTSDMLKTLIERNDFYSKESNPHLDAPYLPIPKFQSSSYSYSV